MMKDSTAKKLAEDERENTAAEYEKKIEILKEEHIRAIEALQQKHTNEVEQHNIALDKLKTDHRIELSQQKGFLEEARIDQKDLKNTIEDLRSEILIKMDKLRTAAAQKESADRRIQDLERSIAEMGDLLSDCNKTIERLREEQLLLQKAMELVLRRLNGHGVKGIE